MDSLKFIKGIKESVIDSNFLIYQNIFKNTDKLKVTDDYWIKALAFFDSLNTEQKSALFNVIHQVQVDTVSNFLSVLDNISVLPDQLEDFALMLPNSTKPLNGDLQDIFLANEELENNL